MLKQDKKNPIPKKMGLPLIGQYFKFKSSPLDFFDYLFDQTADLIQFQIGPLEPYLICNPELVREILVKKSDNFHKFTSGVNVATGDNVRSTETSNVRKGQHIAVSAFTKKAFKSYIPKITNIIDNLELNHKYETTDMIIKKFTLTNFFSTIFNFDITDRIEIILDRLDESIDLVFDRFTSIFSLPLYIPTPSNRKINSVISLVDELTTDVIKSHLDKPSGLLQVLFDTYDIQHITSDNIDQVKKEIMTLILAGFKTTAFVLNTLLYHLAKYQDVQDKIIDELRDIDESIEVEQQLNSMRYTKQVIEEVMRLYPPVWMMLRKVGKDCEILNYQFRKDDIILISPYLLHRHQDYWQFGDEFIPDRFHIEKRVKNSQYRYIPFGAGKYKCLGRNFAIQQILLFIHQVLPKYQINLKEDTVFDYTASISMQLDDHLDLNFLQR